MTFECPDCGKEYKTEKPFLKHIKLCSPDGGESEEVILHSTSDLDEIPPSSVPASGDKETEVEHSSWVDYEPEIEEGITEQLPTPLKFIEKLASQPKKKKYTKKELAEIQKANIALLKMGLGSLDYLITKYGQAVTEKDDYLCKHSDNDKTMVANAQNAWLEEKGVNLSKHIGTGKIALIMTSYYIAPPIVDINKRKTKRLIRRGLFKSLKLKMKSGFNKLKPKRFRKKKDVSDNEQFIE